jgi:uncharacterized membrane protein required for colicin V production
MKNELSFNWFDLLVMATLVIGLLRGRKRGMSEELLDVFMWLCIIVVGALAYRPAGRLLAQVTNFGLLASNIIGYALVAAILTLIFTSVKRAVGEKLVHSDAFGRFEYYFGMLAGALRFFCVLLFLINFLHAKYISDAERAATARMQAENFGSISFPTMGSLQHAIFYESVSGKFIRKHLRDQLIEPVAGKGGAGDTIGKRRQRDVEEVLK